MQTVNVKALHALTSATSVTIADIHPDMGNKAQVATPA
jgi:hypothetical protein